MKKPSAILLLFIIVLLRIPSHAQDLHSKIVFSTPGIPDDSIWCTNADGSNKQFITSGNWPRVSADKHYMAFLRGGQTVKSRNSIYLRDLTTMHDTLLVASFDYNVNFDFNPSSTQLTFDAYCYIYQINITGGNFASLPLNTGDCWNDVPRLRQSDSLIAFQNLHWGILTASYDGTNAALIPNTLPGDLDPSWSPSGTWICFTRDYPGVDYVSHNYFKIHPDGTNLTQITNLTDNDTLGMIGTWSNDENYIVAAARINGVTGIYKIAANSSGEIDLLTQLPVQYSPVSIAVGNADSISGIADGTGSLSLSFSSSSLKIFPNPVHDFVTARISLNQSTRIKLIVCDQSGRDLQTVTDGWASAGTHSFQFNIQSLPNGIYWCRLFTGNENYTAKLTVIK